MAVSKRNHIKKNNKQQLYFCDQMMTPRPYFTHRPSQIIRRLLRTVQRPEPTSVFLPWGTLLHIDPREMIGNAIWRTGIYDLAVTEAVYRLLPVGGTGVDAGANIGYITSLMQVRAGLTGRVYAFEPHPEIVKRLNVNVQEGPGCASVHAIGLSDRDGTAHLILQDAETGVPFNLNNGVAHIGEGSDSSKCSIRVSRLDNIIENERVNVLKIDVEGHEYKVLKGAIKLIKNKNISSIIFEDHEGFDSDVCKLLKSFGYTVWRLSLTHRRLRLLTPDDPVPPAYAPPNFVAGLDAEHTYETLRSPGWQSI